jgi:hypothetical protein
MGRLKLTKLDTKSDITADTIENRGSLENILKTFTSITWKIWKKNG